MISQSQYNGRLLESWNQSLGELNFTVKGKPAGSVQVKKSQGKEKPSHF